MYNEDVEYRTKRDAAPQWDAQRVRALRDHLGLTQQRMSEELGTRQQTISEWEKGMYRPRGTSRTVLNLVAERAGFEYKAASSSDAMASLGEDTEKA